MRYSCCIEMMFTELPFVDRIQAARRAGFEFIEFWTWQDKDIPAVERALTDSGMKVSIFQGNTVGRMVDPAERDAYLEGVRLSLPVAKRLGCQTLFLMSDIMGPDRSVEAPPLPLLPEDKRRATVEVLKALAPIGEAWGITFVIEPLNTLVDHAGYSLSSSSEALAIVREVASPRVRLLYDAYHMQIMEGNVIETIRRGAGWFGHFHVADVPGRNQPGTGELNYRNILRALGATGYQGAVGFEFNPAGGRSEDVLRRVFEAID